MSRTGLTIGVAICLLLGIADLGLVNIHLAPAAFPPAGQADPGAGAAEEAAADSGAVDGRTVDGRTVDRSDAAAAAPDSAPQLSAAAPAPRPDAAPAPRPDSAPPSPPAASPPLAALTPVVILFDTASHALRPQARQLLTRIAATLQRYPGLRVQVEGHTDQRGEERFNTRLSELRNGVVVTFLRQRGISAARIARRAFGSTRPVDRGETPAAWQRNRRVEVKVTKETP